MNFIAILSPYKTVFYRLKKIYNCRNSPKKELPIVLVMTFNGITLNLFIKIFLLIN